MPTNKNQHYLPQHYLRLFSVDGLKNIGVVRLDPFKFATGPIKGQCQAEWFYREDGELDEWLKETEGAYGKMLPDIISARKLTDEWLVGCRFLAALFNIRTQKASEIHGLPSRRHFFDVVNEGIRRGEVPPAPPGWSMEQVGVKGVSGFLVKTVLLQTFFEMSTLNCKLLEPGGKSTFVTSDHPCVCMNQLFAAEVAKTGRSFTGFSRSGFQLVLPICPTLCLFFYDPKVYKVGSKRDKIVTLKDEDVLLLNSLQVQNADKCLYTSDPQSEPSMKSMVEQFLGFRRPTSDLLRVSKLNDTDEFHHFRSPEIFLARPWSFCGLQSHPRIPPTRRRNQVWTDLVQAYTEHVDKEKPIDVLGEFVRYTERYCAP